MTDALDRVRERGRARKRREAAKERGRKHIEAARARARKSIEAARARARAWLAAASRPRVRVVVKEGKPSAKRRTKATSAKPKGKPKPMTEPKVFRPIAIAAKSLDFLTAVHAVSAQNKPGALLSIREVRDRANLSKADFDRTALAFAAKRELVLHHHDFPESLSAAQRAVLIEDDKGTVYIGLALPTRPAGFVGHEKLLVKARLYGAGNPVRIASLRKDVSLTPAEFDAALGALQRLGKVKLYRDDNRVTAKDEGAYFVAGEPRHILYVRD